MNNTTTSILLAVFAIGLSAIPALAETEILSPFKQYSSGIPINEIQCSDSKILMESPRNTPACVTENSVDRLLQIGFNVIAITVDSTNTDVEKQDSTNVKSTVDNVNPVIASPIEELDASVDKSTSTNSTVQTTHEEPVYILNPKNISELIPQDILYPSVIKLPPDDPDAFAQKIADYFGIRIIDKREMYDKYRYFLENEGYIELEKYTQRYLKVTIQLVHPHSFEISTGHEQARDFFEYMGIDLKLATYESAIRPTSVDKKRYFQNAHGYHLSTNTLHVNLHGGYTMIFFGYWNDNLNEMKLADPTNLKEASTRFVLEHDKFLNVGCKDNHVEDGIYFEQWTKPSLQLYDERPIYKLQLVYCSIPSPTRSSDGVSLTYFGFFDAVTGNLLYVERTGSAGGSRVNDETGEFEEFIPLRETVDYHIDADDIRYVANEAIVSRHDATQALIDADNDVQKAIDILKRMQ